MKDEQFPRFKPSTNDAVRRRAKEIKEMLEDVDRSIERTCWVGKAIVDMLKEEQYELAKEL